MTVQRRRQKFTVGQYHQMFESGILTERDRVEGRLGRCDFGVFRWWVEPRIFIIQNAKTVVHRCVR